MVEKGHGLPSLAAITIRRGILAGRLYLGLATLLVLVLSFVLLHARPGVFATTFPLELPLFASLGATGGIMLFASDRTKGVLEYLIAYGVRPGALFTNILLTTVVLATIVLGAALAVALGAYAALGNPFTIDLEKAILLYSIPMAFAGALFSTIAGMVWSSLSTPRAGLNSPVGIAPLLAVGPTILVLFVAEASPASQYYYVTAGAAGAFLLVVVVLLVGATRLMGRERYLSPM